MTLPVKLYRAEQVRELDRLAIEEQAIPGFTLMRRAGKAAFECLLRSWPELKKLTVFCGTGNNGGDGFVIATLARQRGIDVDIVQVGDGNTIKGDALQAKQLAEQDGIVIIKVSEFTAVDGAVLVDALLGTGLSGDVRGEYLEAITQINESVSPVLAVDIPSGLCSDTGCILGEAVVAQQTVSFIGLKQGLLTGQGPDFVGELHYADLSVAESIFEQVQPSSERLLVKPLTPRKRCAYKSHYGHVMVTGGGLGMAGAASLTSQAAARLGAGLISCATRPEHVSAIVAGCPEIMVHGVISGQEIEPLLERASVVVVGPGLGRGSWGEQLLQKVVALNVPLVVDADALNILAAGRVVSKPYRDNWILTPHPGEAARLLNCEIADIEADRFAAVQALQKRYGGAVILKGAGTLVADADHTLPGLCDYGNPGMAAGGMGDVLSGVLGALLAQGLSVAEAARLGVCLHGAAGDLAAKEGERGTMASDLLPHLRTLVNTNNAC